MNIQTVLILQLYFKLKQNAFCDILYFIIMLGTVSKLSDKIIISESWRYYLYVLYEDRFDVHNLSVQKTKEFAVGIPLIKNLMEKV